MLTDQSAQGDAGMSRYATVSTPVLDIAYLEWNPRGQQVAVLVHGWPDCPEGWEPVAERLAATGYRVLCPTLRGFGQTRFLRRADPTQRSARRAGS